MLELYEDIDCIQLNIIRLNPENYKINDKSQGSAFGGKMVIA
ncbi:hypothetical protein PI126_g14166 [Phytophthora idaei]|nr:hypothetical protein PI126_g14166 [Phytophthora idaei]